MQPVFAPLPKLDLVRFDPVAAPKRRQELCLGNLPGFLISFQNARVEMTLLCGEAQAASWLPKGRVTVSENSATEFLGEAVHTDLALKCKPGNSEPHAGLEICSALRSRDGEKHETTGIKCQQNGAEGWAPGGRGGREAHRVGLRDRRPALAKPQSN